MDFEKRKKRKECGPCIQFYRNC